MYHFDFTVALCKCESSMNVMLNYYLHNTHKHTQYFLLSIYILRDTICFCIPCTCTYRSLCNYIIGFIIDAVTIYTKYISHNAASPINLPPDERQHIEGKRTSAFLRLSEKFLVHVIIGYTK